VAGRPGPANDDRATGFQASYTQSSALPSAKYLSGEGERVEEIDASRHVGRRCSGKSDAIDAVRAARELLARPRPAQMRCDGDREALHPLMIDRDNAVAWAKAARTLLASVLVTAPALLRERLPPIPRSDLEKQIAALVEDLAPGLVAAEPGVGALTAAQVLLSFSHPGRNLTVVQIGVVAAIAANNLEHAGGQGAQPP
jgi:transposase